MEPLLSVVKMPLFLPMTSPLDVVTLNCAPDNGLPLSASFFKITREHIGWFWKCTLYVAPSVPISMVCGFVSQAYPSGAMRSVTT